jgi:hypothetical protein
MITEKVSSHNFHTAQQLELQARRASISVMLSTFGEQISKGCENLTCSAHEDVKRDLAHLIFRHHAKHPAHILVVCQVRVALQIGARQVDTPLT